MKSFSTSILTPDEVNISGTRIVDIINATIANDPFIKKVDPKIRISLQKLTTALGRTTDSTYVKLLGTKDVVRDTRFITLRDYSKSFVYDADVTLANAAKTLVDLFKELGWAMYSEGYATESSLLQTLLARLEKAPVSDAVTVLNATSRVVALKEAQADFELTFNNKIDVKTREEYPLIRESRVSVARYLSALLNYIDMMEELEGGVYSTAAGKINEVIVEIESIARSRQTKNKNEGKKTA